MLLLGVIQAQASGQAAGSFDLLETQVLSNNSTATVEFLSGGTWAAYSHLQVRVVASQYYASGSTLGSNIRIELNGSSTTYRGHFLRGNGSVVGSGEYTSTSSWNRIPVSSSTSVDNFGAFVVDILDINNTSKNTTLRGIGGSTSTDNWIELASGAWFSTAQVTSIQIKANETALGNKSRFSLYGIRGV